jgi:hypothetical protein
VLLGLGLDSVSGAPLETMAERVGLGGGGGGGGVTCSRNPRQGKGFEPKR